METNGRERTHLLLHPDHARPLLYEEAVALLPKVRLEVGLQSMGIPARCKLYQAYQFRILFELLEGFREASIMEIVEDCFVSVNEID
jgi:hypothetical protein